MKLTCANQTCMTELNYSEPVILGLFINGVSDMELQQDLLAKRYSVPADSYKTVTNAWQGFH
jgi:hypothetical protein